MSFYLSFLIGAGNIKDAELEELKVQVVEKESSGIRKLRLPAKSLDKYLELIRLKLTPGFWNEVVGAKEILFVFKFRDGKNKEFKLSLENELEISKLCTEF